MKFFIFCYLCGFNLSPESPITPPVRPTTEFNEFELTKKLKRTTSMKDLKKIIKEANKNDKTPE